MVAPITVAEAKAFIARHHRHARAPLQAIFAVAVEHEGEIVGVATAERPKARGLCDGRTVEISRVATDGARNACSMLYGACRRAARALGYTRVITYTLERENGASLRAAGFRATAKLKARPTWACAARVRYDADLFGEEARDAGPKTRWEWEMPGAPPPERAGEER